MNSPCDSVARRDRHRAPTATSSRPTLTNCWPGTAIGLPGMSSWSLPKAMFEPQNETEPMIAANRIGISVSERGVAAGREGVRGTPPTRSAPPRRRRRR